jgi:hypothetical protein
MVIPLSYFIERPFQNWTRDTQSLIGAIALHMAMGRPSRSRRGPIAEACGDRFLFRMPRVETFREAGIVLASINPGCNGYG